MATLIRYNHWRRWTERGMIICQAAAIWPNSSVPLIKTTQSKQLSPSLSLSLSTSCWLIIWCWWISLISYILCAYHPRVSNTLLKLITFLLRKIEEAIELLCLLSPFPSLLLLPQKPCTFSPAHIRLLVSWALMGQIFCWQICRLSRNEPPSDECLY